MARRPAVTCSPEATTASYSRASCSSEASRHPGDELVGRARHRRDHDGDVVAGVDLALDVAGDVADALDIGDGGAAEFHDDDGHAAPLAAPGPARGHPSAPAFRATLPDEISSLRGVLLSVTVEACNPSDGGVEP
jgi:hypothetical protein